jgi:hypothetical protein
MVTLRFKTNTPFIREARRAITEGRRPAVELAVLQSLVRGFLMHMTRADADLILAWAETLPGWTLTAIDCNDLPPKQQLSSTGRFNWTVMLWLSPDEKAEIKRRARLAGLSVGQFLASKALDLSDRPKLRVKRAKKSEPAAEPVSAP